MTKEVTLPSGAKLKITLAPFADAKALYQAMLEEAKSLQLDPEADIGHPNLIKDLFCTALSSKKIEACLVKCMERATYNDLKINNDTFEPESARDDYFTVCFEIAKENVAPFTKSLYARYSHLLGVLKNVPPA